MHRDIAPGANPRGLVFAPDCGRAPRAVGAISLAGFLASCADRGAPTAIGPHPSNQLPCHDVLRLQSRTWSSFRSCRRPSRHRHSTMQANSNLITHVARRRRSRANSAGASDRMYTKTWPAAAKNSTQASSALARMQWQVGYGRTMKGACSIKGASVGEVTILPPCCSS